MSGTQHLVIYCWSSTGFAHCMIWWIENKLFFLSRYANDMTTADWLFSVWNCLFKIIAKRSSCPCMDWFRFWLVGGFVFVFHYLDIRLPSTKSCAVVFVYARACVRELFSIPCDSLFLSPVTYPSAVLIGAYGCRVVAVLLPYRAPLGGNWAPSGLQEATGALTDRFGHLPHLPR